jgi:hypothetical protein
MSVPNLDQILQAMAGKSYVVFADSQGHDLNIVGIRTNDNSSNRFNDWLTVFYRTLDTWVFFAFPATTDPGIFYRLHPINVNGTAIIKPGQYRGAYKVGLHKGYRALQQKGPITVWRDADKDAELDTDGSEDTGIHAVNIHRANPNRASQQIDKWSAGCQVIADPDHFDFLITLCGRAKVKYGNSFTYTLLEEQDLL